uniref:Ethylene receptor n=1 Tax=Rhizophora mucronata TaxID=61149 RepID=A0A2P2IRH4_RHIMU
MSLHKINKPLTYHKAKPSATRASGCPRLSLNKLGKYLRNILGLYSCS